MTSSTNQKVHIGVWGMPQWEEPATATLKYRENWMKFGP